MIDHCWHRGLWLTTADMQTSDKCCNTMSLLPSNDVSRSSSKCQMSTCLFIVNYIVPNKLFIHSCPKHLVCKVWGISSLTKTTRNCAVCVVISLLHIWFFQDSETFATFVAWQGNRCQDDLQAATLRIVPSGTLRND